MKSFFSIISVQTNAHSSESIAVGLVVVADKVYFNYSNSKLQWINKLYLGGDMYHLSLSSLKKIKQIVEKENKENTNKLFDSLFSVEYFSYLSQYSGGILHFSEPVTLPILMNEETFKDYYCKMIGEKSIDKKPQSFHHKIKGIYKKTKADDFADIDYLMNISIFSNILTNTKLSLITKNGAVTAAQIVDFSVNENTVANHLYKAMKVNKGLKEFGKEKTLQMNNLQIIYDEELKNEGQNTLDKMAEKTKVFFDFQSSKDFESFLTHAHESKEYSKFSLFANEE